MDIIKLYVFNGREHLPADDEKDLWNDAYWVMEKIKDTPIHRFIKGGDKVCQKVNPVYDEILDVVIEHCDCNYIVECLTVNI